MSAGTWVVRDCVLPACNVTSEGRIVFGLIAPSDKVLTYVGYPQATGIWMENIS